MNATVAPVRPARSSRKAASPRSAGEVVLDALRAQVEHLRAQELGARQAIPSAVAEMRVTTRQLRSTLRGFSRVLDAQATLPVAQELKWLGAQLGEENDTEAMIKEFNRLLAALPQDLIRGPVETELDHELGRLTQRANTPPRRPWPATATWPCSVCSTSCSPTRPSPAAPTGPHPPSCPRTWPRPSAGSIAGWPRRRRLSLDRPGTRRCTRRARPTSRCAT